MYCGVQTQDVLMNYFTNAISCYSTGGLKYGHIIRYHTIYLKVYDSQKNEALYQVEGYFYDRKEPIFVDHVPLAQLREYAIKVESLFR